MDPDNARHIWVYLGEFLGLDEICKLIRTCKTLRKVLWNSLLKRIRKCFELFLEFNRMNHMLRSDSYCSSIVHLNDDGELWQSSLPAFVNLEKNNSLCVTVREKRKGDPRALSRTLIFQVMSRDLLPLGSATGVYDRGRLRCHVGPNRVEPTNTLFTISEIRYRLFTKFWK